MSATRITHFPAGALHVSKPTWWLESRFHFNFANFFGGREQFGALRVLNDDLVKPKAGFGRHPHRNAEIFSYIVRGELTHQDSMGNKESLPRGGVQYMSAGTGVVHSEMNDGDKTCRFLQIWFMPDATGHTPQYGSSTYTKEQRHNALLHILGGTGSVPKWPTVSQGECTNLHQDANVFVSESDPNFTHNIQLGANRQAYLVCIEGEVTLGSPDSELQVKERDGVEIVAGGKGPLYLDIKAGEKGGHFMLLEMSERPKVAGW